MGTIPQILGGDDPVIAVVGATDNLHKYGSKIYRNLKAKGYTVYPLNLVSDTVDGDRAYADLGDLPVKPDIVNIVVPPPRTRKVVERCVDLGLDHIWIQPGAEDASVLAYLDEHGIHYLANACIMVHARRRIDA
jgi:predicted CoA-binding protein